MCKLYKNKIVFIIIIFIFIIGEEGKYGGFLGLVSVFYQQSPKSWFGPGKRDLVAGPR
jgi:hypothetical protein